MNPIKNAKRLAVTAATSVPLRWVFQAALGERAVVFMLHRFRHPDLGVQGHDPAVLAQGLGELRRRGYTLLDIGELAARIRTPGMSLARTVSFTIDDGR